MRAAHVDVKKLYAHAFGRLDRFSQYLDELAQLRGAASASRGGVSCPAPAEDACEEADEDGEDGGNGNGGNGKGSTAAEEEDDP